MIKQIFIKNVAVTALRRAILLRQATNQLAEGVLNAIPCFPKDSKAYGVLNELLGALDEALEVEIWDVNPGTWEGYHHAH
jgi:hypothetical protein